METRRDFLKKVIFGAGGALLSSKGFSLQGGEFEALRGLCYGPFRQGQSPGAVYPSESQVREDMVLLKNYTGKIRTYGVENILGQIPRICNEEGMNVYPGAWIGTDLSANSSQISALINIANQNYSRTKGLIVGNEVLLFNRQPKSTLINYINQVKSITTTPVGCFEPWHIWADDANSDLVSAVDFVLMGVHPYWESQYWNPNLSIDNAVSHVIARYNQVKAKYPTKEVVIGETGWPSQGPANYSAVPSVENQKRFLEEFETSAKQNGIDYFFFEAFDEPWKGEGGVGAYWGLFDKNRVKKQGLSELLKRDFKIRDIKRNGNNSIIRVNTFEGNPYKLHISNNPSNSSVNTTNFNGGVGTNFTDVVINSSAPREFYFGEQLF